MNIELVAATSAEHIAIARELFREYAAELTIDLCFQNFEEERSTLPGSYAPPRGRLLLAKGAGQNAGCIALRPMDNEAAELKRLYVRPAFRRRGIGKTLVARVLDEARRAGYRVARLDTLREMHDAIALYSNFGFTEVAPYRKDEPEKIRYFEKKLNDFG
jgi:ribosomal protein S18 acetylase RimI-like enzyme